MEGQEDKLFKNNKPEWFCESSNLSLEDQEWIWNNIPKETNDNVNVSGNGNDNGACKTGPKLLSFLDKKIVIDQLKDCNIKTPPKETARLLETLFQDCPSKIGHWLYIAQRWPPRTVNSVIGRMIKEQESGEQSIQNPAAYFTYLIKFRKKRKKYAKGEE